MEEERLSTVEFVKLYDEQIKSHEKAKLEAVEREDYELAAQLKTTLENLKTQRNEVSVSGNSSSSSRDQISTLDKKAWASGALASDVSPYRGMKENPECWPLPFHLNEVSF